MLVPRYFAALFISYMDVLSTREVTLSIVRKIPSPVDQWKLRTNSSRRQQRNLHITLVYREVIASRSNVAENGNGLSCVREDRHGLNDDQRPVPRMQYDFILGTNLK